MGRVITFGRRELRFPTVCRDSEIAPTEYELAQGVIIQIGSIRTVMNPSP